MGIVKSIIKAIMVGTAFTQQFQLARGFSPLEAGLFIMPLPVAAFFSGLLAGWIMPRVNTLTIQWISLLTTGVGLVSFLFANNAAQSVQFGCLLIIGTGIGAAMTAASNVIMNNAPLEKAGTAASIEEVSYELGSVTGVAVLGSLSAAIYSGALEVGNLAVPAVVYDSLDEALLVAEGLPVAAATSLATTAQAAFNQAFLAVLAAAAGILFLSGLIISIAAQRAKTS